MDPTDLDVSKTITNIRAAFGFDHSSDEKSSWRTLESLKQMASAVDFKWWLAAVDDAVRAAIPENPKLLEQFTTLKEESDKVTAESADDSKRENCRKKVLGFIEMTEHILRVNKPASSGLQEEIRDMITKEISSTGPYKTVMFCCVVLLCGLLGVDFYYGNKAKEIIQQMESQLTIALNQTSQKSAALGKIIDDAQNNAKQKSAQLNDSLNGALSALNEAKGKAATSVDNAGKDAAGKVAQAGETGASNVSKEWNDKLENLRQQKLRIDQIPWTGWLFGGGYGIVVLNLLISVGAVFLAFKLGRRSVRGSS